MEYDSIRKEASPLTLRELNIIQMKHVVNRILIAVTWMYYEVTLNDKFNVAFLWTQAKVKRKRVPVGDGCRQS